MRKLLICYLVAIHLLLGYLVARSVQRHMSPELPKREQYIAYSRDILKVMDKNRPAHSVVFIGDSMVECFALARVNYGIGMSTTKDLNNRIGDYNLTDVKALVLMIGTNDVLLGQEPQHLNLPDVPIYWYAAPPLKGHDVKQMNDGFKQQCSARPKCKFIELDLGENDFIDGVHLNRDGYAIWTDSLKHLAVFE